MEFDNTVDYYDRLTEKEKYNSEYPLLKGLQRLAHTNRGGIKKVYTRIIKAPGLDTGQIAAVEYSVEFADGTVFSGSADATDKAHKAPFNLHLVAVAESKAESRALRRAFNISKVAFEEIGAVSEVAGEPDKSPITDVQVSGITMVAKRKKLTQKDVLKLIKREDLNEIKELTSSEGRDAMKAINSAKVKETPSE